jgi:hypothetical protein
MAGMLTRAHLEQELLKIKGEESKIDAELALFFKSASNESSSGNSFASYDIPNTLKKIQEFAPCFEVVEQDSKKFVNQVEDCRALSERISGIVRRLDTMQIRSQQALACTESIIDLKNNKMKITKAIEDKNLVLAVKYIKQTHSVDEKASLMNSDDYTAILEKEKEVKALVQKDFATAIADSNIKQVMSLCPLLQTLGLEAEARDSFLDFMEVSCCVACSLVGVSWVRWC